MPRAALTGKSPVGTKGERSSMPLRGQGLVEYALIIALVAILGIAALVVFGPAVTAILSNVTGSV